MIAHGKDIKVITGNSKDGVPGLGFPVLPGVAKIRDHRGDPPGGGTLQGIDHDKQLHQRVVHSIELAILDMVVSPDVGSVARARAFAQKLNMPLAIVDKRRQKANSSEVMNIIGDVRDKRVILLDDMVDTGGSLCHAAKALVETPPWCRPGCPYTCG